MHDARADLHPEALDELIAAAEWLDSEGGGLGEAFLQAVDERIARIELFPYLSRRVNLVGIPDDVRQCVIRRYRYLLIYRVQGDQIQVIAVAHMRRKPGYWRGRLA